MKACSGTACWYDVAVGGPTGWRSSRIGVAEPIDQAGPMYGSDPLAGIVAIDDNHLVVYGSSGLRFSGDGGASWRVLAAPGIFLAATVADGVAWLVCNKCPYGSGGQGAITVDGSAHITDVSPPLASGFVPSAVFGLGGEVAVSSSDGSGDRAVLQTGDGGKRWRPAARTPCAPEADSHVNEVSTDGRRIVLLCVGEPGAGEEVKSTYASDDAGASWSRLPAAEVVGYADAMDEPMPGLVWRFGGRAPIYRSTDGGRSWTALLADRVGDAAGPELGAFAAAGRSAWVFVHPLKGLGVEAYSTADAGAPWAPDAVPLS